MHVSDEQVQGRKQSWRNVKKSFNINNTCLSRCGDLWFLRCQTRRISDLSISRDKISYHGRVRLRCLEIALFNFVCQIMILSVYFLRFWRAFAFKVPVEVLRSSLSMKPRFEICARIREWNTYDTLEIYLLRVAHLPPKRFSLSCKHAVLSAEQLVSRSFYAVTRERKILWTKEDTLRFAVELREVGRLKAAFSSS